MQIEELRTFSKFKTTHNLNIDLYFLSHNFYRNDMINNYIQQYLKFHPEGKILVLCKFITHIKYLSAEIKNSDFMYGNKNTYNHEKNVLIWSGYDGHGAHLTSYFDLVIITIPLTNIPLDIIHHLQGKIIYLIDDNLLSLSKFNDFENFINLMKSMF